MLAVTFNRSLQGGWEWGERGGDLSFLFVRNTKVKRDQQQNEEEKIRFIHDLHILLLSWFSSLMSVYSQ